MYSQNPNNFTVCSTLARSVAVSGMNHMGNKMEELVNNEGEYSTPEKIPFQSVYGGVYDNPLMPSYGKSYDGYNWRKYGQKQVKGSENPRSYYKCALPNCPTKKKVEINGDGHITEIVYKGTHSHPKPQSTRRTSLTSSDNLQINSQSSILPVGNAVNSSTDNSWLSFGDDGFVMPGYSSMSIDNNELDSKRWKMGDNEFERVSASGGSTIREPRIVVQTTSEIDILDDGYRWRKYGQKVVKGNPNPRSYYKCTSNGCPVRKLVERAFQDPGAVITTYEGKHNHDVPPARGSGINNYGFMSNNAGVQLQALQDQNSFNLHMQ